MPGAPKPSQSRITNSRLGGTLLPVIFLSRVGFFSPLTSLLSVPGRPCSLNFGLPEALSLRRLNCWN